MRMAARGRFNAPVAVVDRGSGPSLRHGRAHASRAVPSQGIGAPGEGRVRERGRGQPAGSLLRLRAPRHPPAAPLRGARRRRAPGSRDDSRPRSLNGEFPCPRRPRGSPRGGRNQGPLRSCCSRACAAAPASKQWSESAARPRILNHACKRGRGCPPGRNGKCPASQQFRAWAVAARPAWTRHSTGLGSPYPPAAARPTKRASMRPCGGYASHAAQPLPVL